LNSLIHVVGDSSCSGNPEPCGSGAIIFHKEEETEIKRAVSNRSFILLAEIIAIKIVLDYLKNHIFSNFRGGARRVPPPPGSAPAIETDHYSFLFEIIYLIFNFIY
jgi:hypothetical protein